MSLSERMMSVLSQSHKPTPKDYNFLIESLSQKRDFLTHLTQENSREWLLMQLTSRSDRLARLFQRIRSAPASLLPTELRYSIAEQLVALLLDLLPALSDILEDGTIIETLTPALAICIEQQPPHFPKLARKINTTIIQSLFANESSGNIMRKWGMNARKLMPRDAITIQNWTTALVCMAENCPPDHHGANHQIQLYKALMHLKESLLEHDQSPEIRTTPQNSLPKLDAMTLLDKNDKKGNGAKQNDIESHFSDLNDDLKASLLTFDLEIPHSSRKLQEVVDQLRVDKTSDVLSAIAATFPCSRCKKALTRGSLPSEPTETIPKTILPTADLSLDVLGKLPGTWKVLLSQAAMKSLQSMDHLESVESKLMDLTTMCASDRLAGTQEQRSRLRIPLTTTKCGKDIYILWQIDIGVAGDTGMLQQEVKVWEVGSRNEISKAIDHVILLHHNYSNETIQMCRQHQKRKTGADLLPLKFDKATLIQGNPSSKGPALDVRLVTQETIDMANKFYALTKPVLRSLIANDVSAQFPFDLSEEEVRIIKHFHTSSMILGRSGTGKTTCLIFKLVAKYLASKTTDEKPIQQVLLTRSSHLAEKLRFYANELIRTLDMSSQANNVELKVAESKHQNIEGVATAETALTLPEQSFPLICTFDCFLQILENTVRSMDRQNFEESQDHTTCPSSGLSRAAWEVVGYNSFRLDYWPRFPSFLTKKLPKALVFSEIMGVIKGSASSRESLKHLSRDEYLSRSTRQAPLFSIKDRPMVYDIFELYEDLKIKRSEMDYIDRVIKVLAAIRKDVDLRKLLGRKFHEIYIDEVQDQRTMDIELFLSFINDSRGFHFAGDTAQAIAQDSAFRFEDISALLYDHFAVAGATMNQEELAKPTMFKLAKNYRSHQGILRLASLVMSLLWKGYPDTVDRLGPEVGQLCGPTPTIFLGCGAEILTSTNVGLVNLSENTADFGAEQVILVRDEAMKTELQAQIGDAALVLTILQSKGMEFDDVILWDFFSKCPNASGVRHLSALLNSETAMVYARQHSDMCSELKCLYVAVTRARIQLFLIESSSRVMQPVTNLLQGDNKEPIIDVTSDADHLFEQKLRSLRPGHSVDPRRWSLRGEQFMQATSFKDAHFCFRKAQDTRGTMRAQAKLYAENGRSYKACGDLQNSFEEFEAAKELFVQLNLVADAAVMLEAMDRNDDAARLWREQGAFGKAAALFCQAGLWIDAAQCHECDGKYEAAAAALQRGKNFNELVLFLSRSRTRLDPSFFQRCTRLCKLLLKRGKILEGHRKEAINLLGSLAEQESCFRECDMYVELTELFIFQHRYADVYLLHIQTGQLAEAFQVALKYKLASGDFGITESQIVHLMDSMLTEQAVSALKDTEKQFEVHGVDANSLTPKMEARLGQWKIASSLLPWKPSFTAQQDFDSLEQRDMKIIVSLLNIGRSTLITGCSDLAVLPYGLIHEATNTIKEVVLRDSDEAKSTLRLVTGLRSPTISGEDDRPLPWTPLECPKEGTEDWFSLAVTYVLKNLASTISDFDSKAQQLWKEQKPRHCLKFLTRGFCLAQQRGECSLQRLHQPVRSDDYAQNIMDLLRVVDVICQMNGLYYRRVMDSGFSHSFLPMKRRWLEPLIRQLTYFSALEQDFSVLAAKRLEIARGDMPSAVVSSLEDLLFVRLRQEWARRQFYSTILEQSHFAETMGPNVLSRFNRALSYKLNSERAMHEVMLPSLLRAAGSTGDIGAFEGLFRRFISLLRNLNSENLTCLYSVVTELESVAAFLITKICSPVCLIPYSWLNANASWISRSSNAVQPLGWPGKVQLTECLFWLTRVFCEMLGKLERHPPERLGLVNYPDLLRQRNAEFLAIMVVNIATEKALPSGFDKMWTAVTQTFQTFYCKATDFKADFRTPQDLCAKLNTSFSRYAGKDRLVLLLKTPQQSHAFTGFKNAKRMTFEELRALSVAHTAATWSENDGSDQYTAEDVASVTKIQKFWRKWSPRYRHHQEYLKSTEAQITAKYIALACHSRKSLRIRALLVTIGLELHLKFISAKNMFSALRKCIMSEIDRAEYSDDRWDGLDTGLHQLALIETNLEEVSKVMSEENLENLATSSGSLELEDALKGAAALLERNLSSLLEVRKGLTSVKA